MSTDKHFDLRHENDQFELQASWKGFDNEDSTWELTNNMHEDIPTMLNRLLDVHPDKDLVYTALLEERLCSPDATPASISKCL